MKRTLGVAESRRLPKRPQFHFEYTCWNTYISSWLCPMLRFVTRFKSEPFCKMDEEKIIWTTGKSSTCICTVIKSIACSNNLVLFRFKYWIRVHYYAVILGYNKTHASRGLHLSHIHFSVGYNIIEFLFENCDFP